MHSYAYVDYDNDGEFLVSVTDAGVADGELVSYTYLNGKNSKGESKSDGCGTSGMPSFTIPVTTEAGNYRMRFKVDWDNSDPGGNTGEKGGSILTNGGVIVDVMLTVEAADLDQALVEAKEALEAAIAAADAWETDWQGEGLGKYTAPEGYADVKAAAQTTLANDAATLEEVVAATTALNAAIDGAALNLPQTGRFYRLKGSERYLTSIDSETAGRCMMQDVSEGNGAETILYLTDDMEFVSLANGKVMGLFQGANDRCFLMHDADAPNTMFIKGGLVKGRYLIGSATAAKDFFIYHANAGKLVDRGGLAPGALPAANLVGYYWEIEEVTELPVAVAGGSATTLYSPVALELPAEGVTAYTLVFNAETSNVDARPIAAGSTLEASLPYYLVPAAEATELSFPIAVTQTEPGIAVLDEGEVAVDEEPIYVDGSIFAQTCGTDRSLYAMVEGFFFPAIEDDVIPGFIAYVSAPYTEDDYIYPVNILEAEPEPEPEPEPEVDPELQAAIEALQAALDAANAWETEWMGTTTGKYTPSEAYAEAKAAAEALLAEPTTADAVNAAAEALVAANDGGTLNVPVAGKFYRIQNYVSKLYIANYNYAFDASSWNESNRLPLIEDAEAASAADLYYFDGDYLVSVANGMILGKFASSCEHYNWSVVVASSGIGASDIGFHAVTEKGAYAIATNLEGTKYRYIYGQANLPAANPIAQVDAGGLATPPTHTGYWWYITEATDMNIAVAEGTTAITLTSPVALKANDALKLHTLAYNPNRHSELIKTEAADQAIAAGQPYYAEINADAVSNGVITLEFAEEAAQEEDAAENVLVAAILADAAPAEVVPCVAVNDKFYAVEAVNNGTEEEPVMVSYFPGFAAYVPAVDGITEFKVVSADEASTEPEPEGSINEINANSAASVIYDLQGRRVNRVSRGLYIINGQKILVK